MLILQGIKFEKQEVGKPNFVNKINRKRKGKNEIERENNRSRIKFKVMYKVVIKKS